MNKDFFKGTRVEAEAAMILAADKDHHLRAEEPVAAPTEEDERDADGR